MGRIGHHRSATNARVFACERCCGNRWLSGSERRQAAGSADRGAWAAKGFYRCCLGQPSTAHPAPNKRAKAQLCS